MKVTNQGVPRTPVPKDAQVAAPVATVRDLSVRFPSVHGTVPVVSGVSLDLLAGRTVAVIGESGSGKSLTGLSLLGLLPVRAEATGRVVVGGVDMLASSERVRSRQRGSTIAMVYQDALSSLNPRRRIGRQLVDVCDAGPWSAREMMDLVRIAASDRVLSSYPHQLSGGQRQRVLIAMALAQDPRVIVADEPTTALDVAIQGEIVQLLQRLQGDLGFALLFISHDLGLVASIADDILVMYAGCIVEGGPTVDVLRAPRHPYTLGLLKCSMSLETGDRPLYQIPGTVPTPQEFPSGCRFSTRCWRARELCDYPVERTRLGPSQFVACVAPLEPDDVA